MTACAFVQVSREDEYAESVRSAVKQKSIQMACTFPGETKQRQPSE